MRPEHWHESDAGHDTCPTHDNPHQEDADGDAVAYACDPDHVRAAVAVSDDKLAAQADVPDAANA